MSTIPTKRDACPPWCSEPAGHDCNAEMREHGATISAHTAGHAVTIAATASDAPLIDVTIEGAHYGCHIDGLNAAQARELATFLHDALRRAAARLDEIELCA